MLVIVGNVACFNPKRPYNSSFSYFPQSLKIDGKTKRVPVRVLRKRLQEWEEIRSLATNHCLPDFTCILTCSPSPS